MHLAMNVPLGNLIFRINRNTKVKTNILLVVYSFQIEAFGHNYLLSIISELTIIWVTNVPKLNSS